jgi:hypothetical protein
MDLNTLVGNTPAAIPKYALPSVNFANSPVGSQAIYGATQPVSLATGITTLNTVPPKDYTSSILNPINSVLSTLTSAAGVLNLFRTSAQLPAQTQSTQSAGATGANVVPSGMQPAQVTPAGNTVVLPTGSAASTDISQYLPIVLIAGGILLLVMLLKK